jgi:hypothetical protein
VAISGDFNNDGRTDLAFYRPLSSRQRPWKMVPVLLSNGNGTWDAHSSPAPAYVNAPGVVAIAGDFNDDGRTDLAFHRPVSGAGWTTVPVLLSDGNGTWDAKNSAAAGWANEPGVVAIAGRFNNDARTDLAFYRPLLSPTKPPTGTKPDGTGRIDSGVQPNVTLNGWNIVPVLLSNGNGTWDAHSSPAPAYVNAPGVVAIAGDFNGDGWTDLAFHRPVNGAGWTTVPVLLSDGNGAWDAKNSAAAVWANEPGAVAIAGD